MFRWLDHDNQSERLNDHGKIIANFWNRMAMLDAADDELRIAVAAALTLSWADLMEVTKDVEGFRNMAREGQKDLLVKLIDYEALCVEDGPESEAYAAELLSYYLSMIAADFPDDEQHMAVVLTELGRQADGDFKLA